jgi:streptomycin 6-kinase
VVGPLTSPAGSFAIPETFASATIAREGQAGRAWIDSLPERFVSLLARWELEPDGPFMYGYVGLVLPVTRIGGEPLVLKLSWMDPETEQEADALAAWNGEGAVRLIDFDRDGGALLLERLDAGGDLRTLAPSEAMEIAGGLLRRLAITAPSWARRLDDEAGVLRRTLPERWLATGRCLPRSLLERTLERIEVLTPADRDLLVDTDLHHENVLSGGREPWLAIDPKVVAGDPEFGVAQLLWQPHSGAWCRADLERLFGVLVDAAGLDSERARGWTLVRIVDYWLWAQRLGLTRDAARCERLVAWL